MNNNIEDKNKSPCEKESDLYDYSQKEKWPELKTDVDEGMKILYQKTVYLLRIRRKKMTIQAPGRSKKNNHIIYPGV